MKVVFTAHLLYTIYLLFTSFLTTIYGYQFQFLFLPQLGTNINVF